MTSKVLDAVFYAIEEINQQLPKEQQLDKSTDVVIFGISGRLDSLGLVTLIVAIEQRIEEEFGVTITLTDEGAISQRDSPFRTIGALADYISLLLKEKVNG